MLIKDGTLQTWDPRRNIIVAGEKSKAIARAAEHWIHTAKRSILQTGRFAVALSGGSTPQAIYQEIAVNYATAIDWSKVHLFWSDERAVPSDHPRSNYHSAMESGLKTLPIPLSQIHRMKGEDKDAAGYEDLIRRELSPRLFDLVMLGVGEDGHTASLFPRTTALEEELKLVTSNYIPDQNEWRLTLTIPCINQSAQVAFYAFGESKQAIVPLVLNAAIKSSFPASAIGTPEKKALWILDVAAAHLL
ncbi:MAG: 6-phosphogluconolactonase [Verrucomicrobiota bacterium]|nr:6-phosphogluconolactonase [Verrucomicrobiota bacterium]